MSEISKEFSAIVMENPLTRGLYENGTAAAVLETALQGFCRPKTFTTANLNRAESISAEAMNEKILVGKGRVVTPVP